MFSFAPVLFVNKMLQKVQNHRFKARFYCFCKSFCRKMKKTGFSLSVRLFRRFSEKNSEKAEKKNFSFRNSF